MTTVCDLTVRSFLLRMLLGGGDSFTAGVVVMVAVTVVQQRCSVFLTRVIIGRL